MNCRNCGGNIDDDILYCPNCGKEVQIVPDYNPLDEVLAAQVKGAINGGTFTLPIDKFTSDFEKENSASRRRSSNNMQRFQEDNQGSNSRDTQRDRDRRRAQQEKRKKQKKKKRMIVIIMMLLVVVTIGLISFFAYQNSYNGQVKKGYNALDAKEFEKATIAFENAIEKDKTRAEAYTGLSKIAIANEDLEKAELIFLDAIENVSNVALYKATINFYIDTNQLEKIAPLLSNCDDETILKELKEYQSDGPTFSLEEGTYDDVQELTLKSKGKAIYYTVDGSNPTISSTKYTEPIQIKEGETSIQAISVNDKDIPSLAVKRMYVIELPIEDAPSVTPSTGQYEQPMKIVIDVPEGYTAYYTMDKTPPTTESTQYTGPIDMPEGNTLFSAILVNSKGRTSDITKKNYELTLN